MAHQIPRPQAQYQNSMPQQHQNTGQRQGPNEQQNFGENIPKVSQTTNPSSQGPLLIAFVMEKPRNATTWEDVVPEQQHVNVYDLKKEVHKFRRNQNNVQRALKEISSPNCRRIINELVEEQSAILAEHNPGMEYRIASIVNKFRERRSLTYRERQLMRVDIILEAEDSGFQAAKPAAGTVSDGFIPTQQMPQQVPQQMPQQRPQPQHPPPPPPPPPPAPAPAPAPGMGPPPPVEPHHQSSFSQGRAHMPMHSQQAPPPPPPPPPPAPNSARHGQVPMNGAAPPPPPPPPMNNGRVHPGATGPHIPPPPMQHHAPRGPSGMPGSYPPNPQIPIPVPGARPGMVHENIDPEILRNQKRRSYSDVSELSSESDLSWEDESEESSFVDVENDMHVNTGHHRRGRNMKKSQRAPGHRLQSKSKRRHDSHGQSRSRSRSHPRRVVHEKHTPKHGKKHRNGSDVDEGYFGRRTPDRSGSVSPPAGHVPPNIHIHMNTNNMTEDRTRSGNASPVNGYHEKKKNKTKKAGKVYTSHDDLSDAYLDQGSGTESYYTSSVGTAADSMWDTPLGRRSSQREPSRRKPTGTAPQRPRDSYEPSPRDYPQRGPEMRSAQQPRYPREAPEDGIPAPHPNLRRQSMHDRDRDYNPFFPDQHHQSQPQTRPDLPHRTRTTPNIPHIPPPHIPPQPTRAYSFAQDMRGDPQRPAYPGRNYDISLDAEAQEEQSILRDLQALLESAREKEKVRGERREASHANNNANNDMRELQSLLEWAREKVKERRARHETSRAYPPSPRLNPQATDRADDDLRELHAVLEWVREKKEKERRERREAGYGFAPSTGGNGNRSGGESRRAVYDDDEWDARRERVGAGKYDGYGRY